MQLYADMLEKVLKEGNGRFIIPGFKINADRIIKTRCYKALREIKKVLEYYTLEDEDCFKRIEEIVCIYENIGSGGGTRHDFG